jgi:HEPN domain-containing protein
MKTFNVQVMLDIVNDISGIASVSANAPDYLDELVSKEDAPNWSGRLEEVGKLCADFGFNALFREVERNRQLIEAGDCTYAELGRIAVNLRTRIQDEYEDILFLWVEKKEYYRQDNLFGEKVAERFNSAVDDIKEAGTCYALGRHTACVFHLQRVMEIGLKALAEPIGESHNPSWDAILQKIDTELKKKWAERKVFFQDKEQQISDAAAMLRAVKTAWRNPTMHVDNTYDDEKALNVWNAVKGFMNSLCDTT